MDFLSDSLADARLFGTFNVFDDYSLDGNGPTITKDQIALLAAFHQQQYPWQVNLYLISLYKIKGITSDWHKVDAAEIWH